MKAGETTPVSANTIRNMTRRNALTVWTRLLSSFARDAEPSSKKGKYAVANVCGAGIIPVPAPAIVRYADLIPARNVKTAARIIVSEHAQVWGKTVEILLCLRIPVIHAVARNAPVVRSV